MDWSKFDEQIDVEGLQKDVKDAEENGGGTRGDVPIGDYEVKIEKLELDQSKAGDPMVKVWFRILEGDYKKSVIFMNQVIKQGFQIHIVNEFLRSIFPEAEIEFVSYAQYGQLLMNLMEDIGCKLEFALKYGETGKGFKTFEIKEVFEVE